VIDPVIERAAACLFLQEGLQFLEKPLLGFLAVPGQSLAQGAIVACYMPKAGLVRQEYP